MCVSKVAMVQYVYTEVLHSCVCACRHISIGTYMYVYTRLVVCVSVGNDRQVTLYLVPISKHLFILCTFVFNDHYL